MSFSLAWPLSSTQLQVAASRSQDLSASAPRCRLRPGTPEAKRRTRSCRHSSSRTKEWSEAAFTYQPVAGSSDDLAFQRQAAVSSTSPLGRRCMDLATLPLLHSCRRHCIRIQISFDNLGQFETIREFAFRCTGKVLDWRTHTVLPL